MSPLTPHFFIGLGGHPIESLFQLTPFGLQISLGRIRWNPDWRSPQKQPAAERIRDHEAIPTVKEFFFEQPNASGTMGSPVALASWMTPF